MELKIYIDEQKVENLHQAAVLADDYALTHKSVFKHSGELTPCTSPKGSSKPVMVVLRHQGRPLVTHHLEEVNDL